MKPLRRADWRLIRVISRHVLEKPRRDERMVIRVLDRGAGKFHPRTERTHAEVSVPFVEALTRPADAEAEKAIERMRALPVTDWERRRAKRMAVQ